MRLARNDRLAQLVRYRILIQRAMIGVVSSVPTGAKLFFAETF